MVEYMFLGYLNNSATCKRAFHITGKHVNEVIEKPCDSVYGFFETITSHHRTICLTTGPVSHSVTGPR